MKIVKKGMRIWITIAAVFSFLGGWVLFSHSPKPASLQISQPLISAPANIPTFSSPNNNSQSGGFLFPQQNQTFNSRTRLRTGGS
jgi:hypothetical protein